MKKIIIVLVVICINAINSLSIAQTVNVVDVETKINRNKCTGISISSSVEAEPLMAAWASYLKKTYKLSVKSGKNEVNVNNALIPAVSASPFDLYTVFTVTDQGCDMVVAAGAGKDLFFSPKDPTGEYQKLKDIVQIFYKAHLAENFDKMISDKKKAISIAEKELKTMEKEIKSLEKENEKALKEIVKMQEQVEKNKSTVQSSKDRLPEMQRMINQKKALLKELESQSK